MIPNSRFSEFLSDIEPSATTKTNSVSAHSSVRDALLADDEFGPRADRIILGGSYKRNTAIRPRQKDGSLDRPDVDLYVVVDVPLYETTPSDEVEALYAALNRARQTLGITKLKRNRVSLSVSMNKADLDVSVLIERQSDDLYRIGRPRHRRLVQDRSGSAYFLVIRAEHPFLWPLQADDEDCEMGAA